ncbi:MAG: hypothetical protein AB1515_02350 [Nitrospirota bacterium]
MSGLIVIPHYTGDRTLEQVLRNPKSSGLLWLEVLLNGDFPWQKHLNDPQVMAAYEKACIWYGHFKTMVSGHTGRHPLEARPGEIDAREYRKFQEALLFVAAGRS